MKTSLIESLTGSYLIYSHNNYVVLLGEKIYIFDSDGSMIACRNDISNAEKLVFVSDDEILICGGRGKYHLVSLKDGREIWSIPQGKRDFSGRQLAFSKDENVVYDYYFHKGDCYFARIELDTRVVDSYKLATGLRATTDIYCDEMGIPCLLQSHRSMVGKTLISENGILYQHQDDLSKGSAYYWKYKWSAESPKIAQSFLWDTDTILTGDLHVYQLQTAKSYYLLENDADFHLPVRAIPSCKTDESKRFIILKYKSMHIVVDFFSRKVISQYTGEWVDSCIVNDTYWISTANGVTVKPFPFVQNPLAKE